MSILQDYEKIKKDIGEYKWNCIDFYVQLYPNLTLDKIIYNEKNWKKYNDWFTKYRMRSIKVSDFWETDYGDIRAIATFGLDGKQFSQVIVSVDEKDINNVLGTEWGGSESGVVENAIASVVAKDFDKYLCLPKISKCSPLLQDIYNTVKETEATMCHITDDDWENYYADKYTNEDIQQLKSEIKLYDLENVITIDDGDYKIIGWGDLETRFNDDIALEKEIEKGMFL